MKTIIAGSRNINDYTLIKDIIKDCTWEITEIIEGTARGVDSCAGSYAIMNNIKLTEFPALWKDFGKYAGQERNLRMADYGDCLIAIWDGESQGTKNMIDRMLELGKKTRIVLVAKKIGI